MAEIIGNKIINLIRVDSTNNYATAHLSINNWNEGTVVITEEQFSGRGQINNTWESDPGCNLLMSIVLYPSFLPVQYQFLLSKIITLGLWDTISALVDDVKIKWPNDLYIGRKKVAGILIENSIMGATLSSSVVGIGLNVNQREFRQGAPNPVSLGQLLGHELSLKKLQNNLFDAIDKWYLELKAGHVETINSMFEKYLYQKDELASYKDKNGIYDGVLKGVNEIGQLLIQTGEGEVRCYHFKEVEYI